MSTPILPNAVHDLVMLYLQHQDLTGQTPQELVDKYLEARAAIDDRLLDRSRPG